MGVSEALAGSAIHKHGGIPCPHSEGAIVAAGDLGSLHAPPSTDKDGSVLTQISWAQHSVLSL